MRRRFSLALIAVLVVLTVFVSTRYLSPRNQAARRVAAAQRDSLARLDSAYRQEADTMCLASRIGLPCDPR
jgi:uncharacterized protein YpmS